MIPGAAGKLGDMEVVALLAQTDHHPTIKATTNTRQSGTITIGTMELGPGGAGGQTARTNGAEQGFDFSLVDIMMSSQIASATPPDWKSAMSLQFMRFVFQFRRITRRPGLSDKWSHNLFTPQHPV